MIQFLFSYGTLQLEKVQLETYGRKLKGKPDKLIGYKLTSLVITFDKRDFIEGVIFEITEYELNETDKYEVSDYKRVSEIFESGKEAWIYVSK